MVKNSLLNNVLEINPIDDRLMSITLDGPVLTTFINTHMETAENHEKNEYRYSKLTELRKKYGKMGPTFTGGDFNARITNENENEGSGCGETGRGLARGSLSGAIVRRGGRGDGVDPREPSGRERSASDRPGRRDP